MRSWVAAALMLPAFDDGGENRQTLWIEHGLSLFGQQCIV
jgi:hypothetical protein